MSSTSVCPGCRANCTEGEVVKSGKNYYWHKSCFVCVDCRKNMLDPSGDSWHIIMLKNPTGDNVTLYCFDCFARIPYPCDKCKKPFTTGDKKVICGSRQWHESCFQCSACQRLVNTALPFFVASAEEIFCKLCFFCVREIGVIKCEKCQQMMTEAGVKLNDKIYHRNCVPSPTISKRLYHEPAASTSASATSVAGELESNEDLVTYNGQQYHVSCYVCHRCRNSLLSENVIRIDDNVYCSVCGSGDSSNSSQSPGT